MEIKKQISIIKKLISIAKDVSIKDITNDDCEPYLLDEKCSSFDLMINFVFLNDKDSKVNNDLLLDIKNLQQVVKALQAEVTTLRPLAFTEQKPFDAQIESTKWIKDMEKFLIEQKPYPTLDVVGYKLLIEQFNGLLPKIENQDVKTSLKEAFQVLQDVCQNFEIPLKPE